MTRIYPDIVQLATINLYDVAPGILLAFDERLRDYANKQFAREGIVIHPNSKVKEVGDGWMDVEGEGRRESPSSSFLLFLPCSTQVQILIMFFRVSGCCL
jgi:NADH dehydrogenase FAD-containing subunit